MAWYAENVDIKNPVKTFRTEDFQTPTVAFAVKEMKQIASYNWLDVPKVNSIMVVPGEPRVFVDNSRNKRTLQPDAGHRMVDRDEVYSPKFMLDPLFYAVNECQSRVADNGDKIQYQQIDLVTDRSNITKMYNTLNPDLYSPNVVCRIDMKRIGNCVLFFSRVEENLEDVRSSEQVSYGLDFKESFTQPTNAAVTVGSFVQISRFNFNDLRILMRFGVDCAEANAKEAESGGALQRPEELPGSHLKVIRYGSTITMDRRMIEMRTRKADRPIPRHMWFLLYISGISRFIMASVYDRTGIIKCLKSEETTDIQRRTGGLRNKSLHLLGNCLRQIIDYMRDQDEGKMFALIWHPSGDAPDASAPTMFDIYETVDASLACDVSEHVRSFIVYH